MPNRDIVVVGASAGGVEALQQLVRGLPADFPGSMFVTIHFPERGTSVLPRILSRAGPLPAEHARDGEEIVPGRIYIAPPDHHLLLDRDALCVIRGPKENGNRPAIDPMFRSAALAFGPRVIGVVLTGNLDDGTSGLAAVKRRGGATVVQDPDDAIFPSMPQSAIAHVSVDYVVPVRMLPATLAELMHQPLPFAEYPLMPDDVKENALSAGELAQIEDAAHHPGVLSPFGCPDCGGVLWELREGDFTRYRCRVGHAWTGDALSAKQDAAVDDALWVALRALEENAALQRQIAKRYHARGTLDREARCEAQAEIAEAHAAVIRESLLRERGFIGLRGHADARDRLPRTGS